MTNSRASDPLRPTATERLTALRAEPHIYDAALIPEGKTLEEHHADVLDLLRASRNVSRYQRKLNRQANSMLGYLHGLLQNGDTAGALFALDARRRQIDANNARQAKP